MNLEKLKPWNWFKHENPGARGANVPVKRGEYPQPAATGNPFDEFHREFDRLFGALNRRFGLPSMYDPDRWASMSLNVFRPEINIASTDTEYTITVEAAGMDEDDISLELDGRSLVIRGEKQDESESREQHFYHIERRFGSFQRVLALPDDADPDSINARMNKGVLTVSMKRLETPEVKGQKIEIRKS